MIEIKGKYNTAKVFTDNIDSETYGQILKICNQHQFSESTIRIMPDCHAGAGCVIGFTANMGDKVIPNIVGVDIGCGMLTLELGKINLDLKKLDDIIRKCVPAGNSIHSTAKVDYKSIFNLKCFKGLKNISRIENSIGTLGGGNHFIEVAVDEEQNNYLVIHTGSRNLGKQVADYYQKLAIKQLAENTLFDKKELILELKKQGKSVEIQNTLNKIKCEKIKVPEELAYLTGKNKEDYIFDMKICQEYAELNRNTIAELILKEMGLSCTNKWSTIHNYIDHGTNIIRKGAVSARKGEKLLIPLNMRDGSLICVGKGNSDWNNSAPHGAGRVLSRKRAKEEISFEEFEKTMEGIFSTSISKSTLDESPFAYKNEEDIIANIGDTVTILTKIKPIYNFKAN